MFVVPVLNGGGPPGIFGQTREHHELVRLGGHRAMIESARMVRLAEYNEFSDSNLLVAFTLVINLRVYWLAIGLYACVGR